MWRWWVWVMCLVAAGPGSAAPRAEPAVRITAELSAAFTSSLQIAITVQPHRGDAWSRLARRISGDGAQWNKLAALNGGGERLTAEQSVRVPFTMLKPSLQLLVIRKLFPDDRPTRDGWRHVVKGNNGVEGESLWQIAEWFTGSGDSYASIRGANPNQSLSTHPGDAVVIPTSLLAPAFKTARDEEEETNEAAHPLAAEEKPAAAVADDQKPAAAKQPEPVALPAMNEKRTSQHDSSSPLTYVTGPHPYAIYKLRKGEALYSAVAIRFTGRVYARDVGSVLDRIIAFNGIDDVSRIPSGYKVRIPMELLLPEYLPPDDPAHRADEASKEASDRLVERAVARNLTGVRIILDAGHGGRDTGAIQGDVFESAYVYDIMCRLKAIIESRSAARVFTTTRSESDGFDVADDDEVDPADDHVVLTTPRYQLQDAIVGVHLRWYLANSIFRRAIEEGIARQKVIFLSIHADSLHPSLRGTMIYIPGAQYVQGSFGKQADVYLTRSEVREQRVVKHSKSESLEAEGLSRALAESMVSSLRNAKLPVHPFNAIRSSIIRDDREWVPAVIRYNLIPTRALLEVCNLGNEEDRALIKTKEYRQRVAVSIYEALTAFFDHGEEPATRSASVTHSSSR